MRDPREQGFTVAEEATQLSRIVMGTEAFLWHHDFLPLEERGDSHTSWVGFNLNDTKMTKKFALVNTTCPQVFFKDCPGLYPPSRSRTPAHDTPSGDLSLD